MCSYIDSNNPRIVCVKVDLSLIEQISKKATKSNKDISDFLSNCLENENIGAIFAKENNILLFYHKYQIQMYINRLKNPLSTHSIKNDYFGMDFGSWESGIFGATHDDFMHSAESFLFCFITNSLYDGLHLKKQENLKV